MPPIRERGDGLSQNLFRHRRRQMGYQNSRKWSLNNPCFPILLGPGLGFLLANLPIQMRTQPS
jgi:hypothetical protein